MRKFRLFMLAILMVGYSSVWTLLALVMVFAGEAPKDLLGWSVVIFNPLVVAGATSLFSRYRQRQEIDG